MERLRTHYGNEPACRAGSQVASVGWICALRVPQEGQFALFEAPDPGWPPPMREATLIDPLGARQ